MQLFGWLVTLAAVIFVIRAKKWNLVRSILSIYPWKILLTLLFVILAGLVLNEVTQKDFFTAINLQSYMIVCFALTLALSQTDLTEKHFRIFLFIVGCLSVYAIIQSFTGIDVLRPGSNRAVNPLYIGTNQSGLFRSAGLLESPIHFSYVVGIQACFLFSYLLIADKKLNPNLFNLSLAVFCLLMISLITSYTRGAWIGIALTMLIMGYLVNRRLGAKLTAGGFVLITIATLLSTQLRERLLSLFDPNFASNSDRLYLWKINWEMFRDHPVLGIGYLQSEAKAEEYATRLGRPDAYISHAHNTYLEMLSSTGLVGLTVYLVLVTYMFWLTVEVYRAVPLDRNWWKILVFGSLGAQLFLHLGGLTEVTFRAPPSNHHLLVIWAVILVGYLKFLMPNRT